MVDDPELCPYLKRYVVEREELQNQLIKRRVSGNTLVWVALLLIPVGTISFVILKAAVT